MTGHSTLVGDVSKSRHSIRETTSSDATGLLDSISCRVHWRTNLLVGEVHQSRKWKKSEDPAIGWESP